jgi:hypothetical protein
MLNALHAAYRGTWSLRDLPGALSRVCCTRAAYCKDASRQAFRQCFVSQGERQLSISHRNRLAGLGLRVGFSHVFLIV